MKCSLGLYLNQHVIFEIILNVLYNTFIILVRPRGGVTLDGGHFGQDEVLLYEVKYFFSKENYKLVDSESQLQSPMLTSHHF